MRLSLRLICRNSGAREGRQSILILTWGLLMRRRRPLMATLRRRRLRLTTGFGTEEMEGVGRVHCAGVGKVVGLGIRIAWALGDLSCF